MHSEGCKKSLPISRQIIDKFGQSFLVVFLSVLVKSFQRNNSRCIGRFFFFIFLFCRRIAIERPYVGIHPHNGNKTPNKRFPSRWTERTGKSDISMPGYPPSSCFFPPRIHPRLFLPLVYRHPPFFFDSLIPFSIRLAASIAYFNARGTRYAFKRP